MNAAVNSARDFERLGPGDPSPWFTQRSTSNERYVFDTVAGRYVVLGFFLSAADSGGKAAIQAVEAQQAFFNDETACFFGVSLDPGDEAEPRVRERLPGLRYLWDFDGSVCRLYGAIPKDGVLGQALPTRRFWMVLDPTLRVMAVFPLDGEGKGAEALFAYLASLPPPSHFAGFEVPPPILVLPNVFEPDLCRRLIGLYDEQGGEESGFMREVNGMTVHISDHKHKRRRDCTIEDAGLIRAIQARFLRRINPELNKIYAFHSTRMERYIVGCYAAEDAAHFRPHRDNTSKGTAYRRFAVSINLNADFEGGEVSFPEYGPRSFKAPPGCAIVFPCALLHAVSRVTQGRRYAFLPFLYDDAAARIREANDPFLEGGGSYKADFAASQTGVP
ncbi:redoxin domain-containing protein [Methylobacterium sp. WL12]|uniref:2OG-Fe(II) oxygenase n=1 Tax=Methylobacterium sp. WL12 TaxID=2603890 RepID=UPI0011C801CE|nr:2OG-Fe(II) oxygenase [Methylobacterium sp. WL12]TXM63715.1 redoxin domain-containing protein [Methylobacterium sp. WL12]